MCLKIDWASLKVRSKFTVFALFYFVFEGNFPSSTNKVYTQPTELDIELEAQRGYRHSLAFILPQGAEERYVERYKILS